MEGATLSTTELKAGDLFKDANEYYKSGDFDKAINTYQKIIEEDGEYEGVYFNLGNAYWRTGEVGKARLYWEKAVKINPANKDAVYNIDLVRKAVDEKNISNFQIDSILNT